MKLYLAGPMTGIPQFNFPLFHEAAAALRALGYGIVNPAETDPPDVQAAALASKDGAYNAAGRVGSETWGDMLARDVKTIADDVDGIVFLPDWVNSRGAKLEAYVGLLTGKQHWFWYCPSTRTAERYSADAVRTALKVYAPIGG